MDKRTYRKEILYNLSLISQMALSLVSPILLMVVLSTYIKNKFGMGDWIVVAGIVLGTASGIKTFFGFMKDYLKKIEKNEESRSDFE
ncbi:MAG: AtpZ/AtpI family protein [Oscillospiraceae bacterium]|nr:AtpZ/AtpI family protein [Oscillospiraceae bacterium]